MVLRFGRSAEVCRTVAGVVGDRGVVAGPCHGSRWVGLCVDEEEALSFRAWPTTFAPPVTPRPTEDPV